MRFPQALLFLLAFVTTIHALALPTSLESFAESSKDLFKRKGGGGGGGRGGGGGGGSRSSGSSSNSGSSGGVRSGSTASNSNMGGSTARGSGSPRNFGGASGGYYGGGAAVPYRAGQASRGVSPVLLGAGAGALILFPALALYGAYAYTYPGNYRYYNQTSRTNESRPMDCYCGRFSSCGCEANNDTDYMNSVVMNSSIAKVQNNRLVVDGTVDNGTTAPGGEGAASSLQQGLYEMSGLWVVVAGVAYTMWLM